MALARFLVSRRFVLAGAGALAALGSGAFAAAAKSPGTLRGSLDAAARGPDETRRLQALLDAASPTGAPVVLPAGDFRVARLRLPPRTHLVGTRGATRLHGPDLRLVGAGAFRVTLEDLVLDASGGDGAVDLVEIADCPDLLVAGCEILGAGRSGLALTRVAGRVEACRLAGARLAGLLSRDATGLLVSGNTVEDCGNGGILVHRSEPGEDGTIVANNRVRRIRSDEGGTGQTGNGINIFRAGGVTVSGNRVEDCAFSAIRSNGGSNVVIAGNSCRDSGETAIYSEFRFEGAAITGNVVEGAAIGISIANFNEGGRLAVCSGNLVRGLRREGPYPADAPGFGMGISAEADTALSGNVVEDAPLFGIKLGWGPFLRDISATGNVVRNCGTGIAVSAVDGSGTTVLSANVVTGSRDGAIRAYRWSEAATPDLLAEPDQAPAHLRLLGNSA